MAKLSSLLRLATACAIACGLTASAATIPSANASYGAVNTAIAAASNGDTVTVPAGTADWPSVLTFNKQITLKGAGKTLTHIRNTNPTSRFYGNPAIIEVVTGGKWRITGFDFDCNWSSGGQGIVVMGNSQAGRINNNLFRNAWTWGVYALPGSYTSGVLDGNVFINCAQSFSYNSDNQTAWTRPLNIGTTNCWVVESNYHEINRGDRFLLYLGDGLWGGKACWRYNVLSNYAFANYDQFIDAHGNQGDTVLTGPNSARGVVFLETYHNLWYTLAANRAHQLRGGTQVHYGNQTICPSSCNLTTFNMLFQLTEEDGFRAGNPVLTAWPGADGITNSFFFRNRLNGAYLNGLLLQYPGLNPCPVRNCPTCQCPGPNPSSDSIFLQSGRDYTLATLPSTNFYRPLASPHPRIVDDNDPPIPPTFALSSPTQLATGVSIQPTLSWADTTIETGYAVMVATDYFFSTMVVSNVVAANTTSYSVPGGLLSPSTTYYWRVWALGANGFNSSANAPFTFTTGSGGAPTVPGSIQLSTNAITVNENAGTVTVTLNRVGGTDGAVGVTYATANGTAISGVNYTGSTSTKSWLAADGTDKTVIIPIIDDATYNPTLTFTLTLSAPTGGATLGSPTTVTISIANTTAPPSPPLIVGLSAHAYEGQISSPGQTNMSGYFYQATDTDNPADGGRVAWRFTIPMTDNYTMTGTVDGSTPSNNSFFIDWDTDPPATPTAIWDVSPLTTGLQERQVSWRGNGTSSAQFPTNVWNLTAGIHTLYVRGREANSLLDLITISAVVVPVPQELAWSQPGYDAPEGTSILAGVNRLGATNGTITVDYVTQDGSAVGGVDYTVTSGTLTFTNGVTSKTITVPLIDNSTYGINKYFYLNLFGATGSTIRSPTNTFLLIRENDLPPATGSIIRKATITNGVIR